jgi:multidrug resistance efflux pump
MRGKWFFAIALTVILVGALAGVWIVLRKRSAPAPLQRASALTLPASGLTTLTGTIRPQHVVGVGSSSSGTIESFLADVGQQVLTGDTLARVSAQGLESAVENAANAVERAQSRVEKADAATNTARLEQSRASADLDRSQAILTEANNQIATAQTRFKVGAISRNAFDAAQASFTAAQHDVELKMKTLRTASDYVDSLQKLADGERKDLEEKNQELQAAKGDLNAADVLAPVDGWVVARKGQPGQPAQDSGNEMFVIATDLAAMEVALDVEPAVFKRVVPGMQALVLIPELTNAALSGDVKGFDGKQVIVEFFNPLPALKPGTKASVHLKLD